jgi:hypothetical protein
VQRQSASEIVGSFGLLFPGGGWDPATLSDVTVVALDLPLYSPHEWESCDCPTVRIPTDQNAVSNTFAAAASLTKEEPDMDLRYCPAARQPQMIDTGMSHIGFRCILRSKDTPQEEVSLESHQEQPKQSVVHKLKTSIKQFFKQFRIIRRALVHPPGPLACEGRRLVCLSLCRESDPDHPQLHPDYRADGRRAGGYPGNQIPQAIYPSKRSR